MNDAMTCWCVLHPGVINQCKTYKLVFSLSSNFKFILFVSLADICSVDGEGPASYSVVVVTPPPLLIVAHLGCFQKEGGSSITTLDSV